MLIQLACPSLLSVCWLWHQPQIPFVSMFCIQMLLYCTSWYNDRGHCFKHWKLYAHRKVQLNGGWTILLPQDGSNITFHSMKHPCFIWIGSHWSCWILDPWSLFNDLSGQKEIPQNTNISLVWNAICHVFINFRNHCWTKSYWPVCVCVCVASSTAIGCCYLVV